MKKIIAIIAGGDSSEHDVSMRSAAGIGSWIDREKFEVYTIETRGTTWLAHLPSGKLSPVYLHNFSFKDDWGKDIKPDFAYITIHGTPGENGILQGYFDLLKIPYSTCSLLVAAMTFDKFTLNQYLKGFGVKVAEEVLVRKNMEVKAKDIAEKVGLPCFVKPNAGGSSFGVTKCKTVEDIPAAIEKAREESDDVLIESLMTGIEIANGVYKTKNGGGQVLPITEVVPKTEFFDYDAKYNGMVEEITPARLSEDTTKRVQALTSAIYDILGASGIMRVDYIISKNEAGDDVINLLEINATPGMTQTSFIPQQMRAAGLNMTDVLTEVIEDKME
ncbi:MAG: D-alanine--D-alanine ligase [Bacteroidaceae bacterium]|nr:D-alanine--D-alanine ligase [Bacteroidaceae bacterium]